MTSGLLEILLNREQGAAELLRGAVDWLLSHPAALEPQPRRKLIAMLKDARPTMTGFRVLAHRLETLPLTRDPLQLAEAVRHIQQEMAAADRRMAGRFADYMQARGPGRILTLSFSTSVQFCLRAALEHVSALRVLESLPGGEGRTTAENMRRFIPNVSCVPDAGLADALAQSDLAVIGADTVFSDGAVLNKVLSAELARAARAAGKPLLVLATQWKRADYPSSHYRRHGADAALFEVVPADLITTILHEDDAVL